VYTVVTTNIEAEYKIDSETFNAAEPVVDKADAERVISRKQFDLEGPAETFNTID
jgi:hypothetical protein